jgi:molybdenum cofactor guanylyltransferase
MGLNKAFLEINGVRLIDGILSVYRQLFSEIIIVTNEPLAYTEFPDTMIVTDIYKGKGSLGGIYSGLFYARHDYAFVAACDMPSLNIEFILFMMAQISKYEIVVPELPEGFQALHAIYSRRCLPAIKRMILADKLKISGLYKDIRSLKITEDKIKPFNQDGRLFLNLNKPEDLHSFTSK